jgi:hypothetical protein
MAFISLAENPVSKIDMLNWIQGLRPSCLDE